MQWLQDPNKNNVDNTMYDVKLVDISGIKRRNI